MNGTKITSDDKLIRELQGDLAHLRRKSEDLIDKIYLTQDDIQSVRARLGSLTRGVPYPFCQKELKQNLTPFVNSRKH